jgi:hypothetical protein
MLPQRHSANVKRQCVELQNSVEEISQTAACFFASHFYNNYSVKALLS